jgi:glycosyltransferase involved in cell wall biosynthesis
LDDGGAEAVLYRLIIAGNKNRHSVVSLTSIGKYGPLLKAAGISVRTLGMQRRRISLGGLVNLYRIIRQQKPDIVQTWMYHADLIGGLIARISGASIVIWGIHNDDISPDKIQLSTRNTVFILVVLSYIIPQAIITCSTRVASSHRKLGYQSNKITVISNGLDLGVFSVRQGAQTALRKEWNIKDDVPLLGMVARWDPQKDHSNLLSALAILSDKKIEFFCVLIGEGLEKSNLSIKQLIDENNLTKKIILTGPRTDIPEVMSALDLHILSSVNEAFSIVVTEAMACGTPCVSTDVGACKNIMGDTGWLVKKENSKQLSEAIETALLEQRKQSEKWNRRRNRCRSRIEKYYSQSIMLSKYQKLWLTN